MNLVSIRALTWWEGRRSNDQEYEGVSQVFPFRLLVLEDWLCHSLAKGTMRARSTSWSSLPALMVCLGRDVDPRKGLCHITENEPKTKL